MMTRSRLRTLGRAFVPFTPRTYDLRYDRDVGESGLSPVSSAGPPLEDAPSGSRTASPGSALSPQGASSCRSGAPPYSSTRSQPVRIGNCDVRRGRTSPPDHCVQTSVTWRRKQSSITKYVLVPEGASSRTDNWENSFPSYLSKAVGGDTPPSEMCPTTHLRRLVSHPASP